MLEVEKFEEADKLIMDTFLKFPNDPQITVLHVSRLLHTENLDEAAQIIGGRYIIAELFPNREVFHIEEYLSFLSFMCSYFSMAGDISTADLYWNLLSEWEEHGHWHNAARIDLNQAKVTTLVPAEEMKRIKERVQIEMQNE